MSCEGEYEEIKRLMSESFNDKNYAPIILLACIFLGADKVKELAESVGGKHEGDEAFKEEDEGALRVGQGIAGAGGEEGVR